MKIGVVTYWYGNSNYGQLLQCWALQSVLRALGHEPYIIKYRPKKGVFSSLKRKFPLLFSILYTIKGDSTQHDWMISNYYDKRRLFQEFREKRLVMGDFNYSSIDELQKNPPVADYYITGSDQVWSQLLSVNNNKAFFLDFGSKDIVRISYAPSFSMTNYPKHLEKQLAEQLSHFKAISVREEAGVDICRKVGYEATLVCDPTLLLKASNYEPLIRISNNKKYVFIYSLNINNSEDIFFSELKFVCEKKEYSIYVTPASGYKPGLKLFGKDVIYKYATVEEWLGYIHEAEFVVTSSFHGVVFCLLFHKPFAFRPVSGVGEKGNNRITDLLERLNLEYLILTKACQYEEIMNCSFDWDLIDERIDEFRRKSICFLKKNIT